MKGYNFRPPVTERAR